MDTSRDYAAHLAQPHRKAVLRALLWITISAGLMFALLNFVYGSVLLGAVEIVMAAYSLVLLRVLRRTRHLESWTLAFLLPFFTAMMFAMAVPRASASVFAWVLLVPIISHLLLGRRLGLAISIVFMAVAGVIFFLKHAGNPALMQALPVANIMIISVSILVFSHVYEVSRERSEVRLLNMAKTDFLTGLANRSRFKDVFEREKHGVERERKPLSLLVIDLDFFKEVNDRYGHETGDEALIFVANLLSGRLRATDLPCRLGGEEFGVILVNTPGAQAIELAEDLRRTLQDTPFVSGSDSIALTMSVGVAEYGPDGVSLQSLLSAADERLYLGKAEGRNRVIGPLAHHSPNRPNRSLAEEASQV
ncbi:diguanylate cyclase [Marinobacter sp.]|uniref:GGDEF domain-containing protein n=1 Tax=Marinobacter sp. TaxID=50741 RepID=UPI00384A577D